MKRNNPEGTYSGRHHVIWIHNPDNQVFNQVSQKIKPESFQEWMDVIYETHRQESGVHHAETQDFSAQEWDSWIRLATQCSCGRTVEPYEYKIDEKNKVVDVKYKCDCGGGICRAKHYGNIYSTPCRNKAEYRGLCIHHAKCERCNVSLKQDYEYFGRDEGHDEGFCNQCYDDTGRYGAETQDFADRFEIQIRTSRGNTTERIPVGRSVLVRRLREILGRQRQPYAVDVFGTEAAFNVMGPFGMQVYRPRPKLLATYKYGRFESGEMADHLNEKLGL